MADHSVTIHIEFDMEQAEPTLNQIRAAANYYICGPDFEPDVDYSREAVRKKFKVYTHHVTHPSTHTSQLADTST